MIALKCTQCALRFFSHKR